MLRPFRTNCFIISYIVFPLLRKMADEYKTLWFGFCHNGKPISDRVKQINQRVQEGISTLVNTKCFFPTPYSFPTTVQNATMNIQPNKASPTVTDLAAVQCMFYLCPQTLYQVSLIGNTGLYLFFCSLRRVC